MLRAIDRFIAAVRRGEGDEVLFVTGEPVRVRSGEQMRVLLAQPVRADQIQAILAPVVPATVDQGFTSDGDATFTVEATDGPVSIRLRRLGNRLDAVLRPVGASETAFDQMMKGKPTPPVASPFADVMSSFVQVTKTKPLPPSSTAAVPAVEAQPPPPPATTTASAPAAPISAGRKQIDPMLHRLVIQEASDLHITASLQPRMRKEGDIVILPGFESALSSDAIRTMLMEIAPLLSREKFEKTNDADFAYEIAGLARFRVNAFKDRRGVSGVLRVIPATILTVEQLKLPPIVRDFCSLERGLVLITGPTGSGKSTTLAAMVDLINRQRSDHIITIEDPVEFVHETKGCLVNQREVQVDTQTFATALRAALREDPNVVVVGEMRDLETVAIAIETAETGHLVLGTMHTTTAVGTIDRLIDQFPADRQQQIRLMLSESLKGVITQALCKKIGGGRVAALEILVGSGAVSNLIREGKTFQIPSLIQTQKQAGMLPLNDALFALVKDGVVAPDEAFHQSVDRPSFKTMLDKAGVTLDKD